MPGLDGGGAESGPSGDGRVAVQWQGKEERMQLCMSTDSWWDATARKGPISLHEVEESCVEAATLGSKGNPMCKRAGGRKGVWWGTSGFSGSALQYDSDTVSMGGMSSCRPRAMIDLAVPRLPEMAMPPIMGSTAPSSSADLMSSCPTTAASG
jgi:hypothetical protein